MTGKPKPKKHTAATNPKYECPHCEVTTPDMSMQIHHDARHPKFPFDESKLSARAENKKDRLSSLPDDILINNILSRLPMLEAQRTSILARTWRPLWSYVPWLGLDLDGCQKRPNNQINNKVVSLQELDEAASKYAEWVDQNIDAYKGTSTATAALRHFRVRFALDYTYTSKIDSWLEFSLRQGVDVLELDCCITMLWRRRYTFLSVEPSRFPNIRLLKSLTLKAVDMPDDSLKGLLLACEFLERLDLEDVPGLTQVNVTGSVSKLKHIHINNCDRVKSIIIQAPTPDLVSFTYPCRDVEITLQHAPRLVDLRLYVSDTHSTVEHPLFRYLSQLQALHLTDFPVDMHPWLGFPVLSRLKHLKLDLSGSAGYVSLRNKLRSLPRLLERAPHLQHLTLEVVYLGWFDLDSIRKELDDMPLELPVPVLEISGFKGFRDADCELALHLIRASPSLEKLIVGQRNTIRTGYMMLSPYERSEEGRKIWEERVKEVIEPELPSKAKLVLV